VAGNAAKRRPVSGCGDRTSEGAAAYKRASSQPGRRETHDLGAAAGEMADRTS